MNEKFYPQDTTATAADIAVGKMAYTKDGLTTGTMSPAAIAAPTLTIASGGIVTANYTLPAGYTAKDTISAIGTLIIPTVAAPIPEIIFNVNTGVATATITGTDGMLAAGQVITSAQYTIPAATQPDPNISLGEGAIVATYTTAAGYTTGGETKSATYTLSAATQPNPTLNISSSGLVTASYTTVAGYTTGGEVKSVSRAFTAYSTSTITPGISAVTIPANSYLANSLTITGDVNFTAANIVYGKSLWGVAGTLGNEVTAVASEVATGKKFYNATGNLVTGTLPTFNNASITPSESGTTVVAGTLVTKNTVTITGDADLIPSNIRQGKSLWNVAGSAVPARKPNPQPDLWFCLSTATSISIGITGIKLQGSTGALTASVSISDGQGVTQRDRKLCDLETSLGIIAKGTIAFWFKSVDMNDTIIALPNGSRAISISGTKFFLFGRSGTLQSEPSTSDWILWICTFDNGTGKVYKNGGTSALTADISGITSSLDFSAITIGAENATSVRYFGGLMIWENKILNAAEMDEIYNFGR